MSEAAPPLLGADGLVRLGRQARAQQRCEVCASLVCPGWEALSGAFERSKLRCVGTLRQPGDEDPTLLEFHPAGSNAWSPDAPIAPAFFPYNRCEAWQCVACARPFLRYTEYGGYYVEERIRELDPALVVDAPL
jgi:hypothetical protein